MPHSSSSKIGINLMAAQITGYLILLLEKVLGFIFILGFVITTYLIFLLMRAFVKQWKGEER